MINPFQLDTRDNTDYKIKDIFVGYYDFTYTGVVEEDQRKRQIQIHKYLPFHSKAPKAAEETQ